MGDYTVHFADPDMLVWLRRLVLFHAYHLT